MTESSWLTIIVALLTGLLVAVYTQWRQDSRHRQTRADDQHRRKDELVFEAQQRQLKAITNFIANLRSLEIERRDEWRVETFDEMDPYQKFTIMVHKNLTFVAKIHTQLDILDLELIDEQVRKYVTTLRTALQEDVVVMPQKIVENPATDIPDMPMLDGRFEETRRELIKVAQKRLNPPPPEKFQPYLT